MSQLRLYESLFIFHKCIHTINRLWQSIHENQHRIHEVENFALLLTNYIKLESVAFTDELNNHFKQNCELEYKNRVSDILDIVKPILDKIFEWEDLRNFRHQIIAHGWRNRKYEFVTPQNFNVPRNWFEVGILVQLMNSLYQMIQYEFEEEIKHAFLWVKSLEVESPPPKDYSNINFELLDVAEKVHVLCKKKQKQYFLKILGYEIEGLEIKKPS